MQSRRLYWLVALLVVLSLVLGACGKSATPAPAGGGEQAAATEAVSSGGEAATEAPTEASAEEAPTQPPAAPHVLKIANTASVTTWDPVKSFSTEAAYMANIYEQLLRINPPDAEERFTPLLAERWEHNDDGTEWTFYLRKGVKFHDGEPLTAEAVKMSIEAAADHGGAAFIWAPLDHIEVVDDYTVKFYLKYAAPLDLIASSLYGAWIISPKALQAAAAFSK